MTDTDTASSTAPGRAGDGLRIALGVGGLIAVVLGLLIMFFPVKSGAVAMQLVAAVMSAYALVVGAVYIGTSIFSKTLGGWARTGHILLGVLYLVGGIVMLVNLGATAAVLTLFLSFTVGALWIFEAVVAFSLVKTSRNKAWTVISGIISLLAGLALLLSPLLGAVTLWLLLGVSMVVLGAVQVVRALRTPAAA
ncbi:DUF308 domain-containing protein [Leucobacter allii]|uniref:HdeD family acid-resistance protein n=1 Tax=Leucobacter allii TaxID=2932247 RepID=UPI001FD27977|nr:DUF308 domain-containing protein [Leucobacter allii]UOR01672.1 DUF308 domain-containing protein [Leucobacter allii]